MEDVTNEVLGQLKEINDYYDNAVIDICREVNKNNIYI